MRDYGKVHTSFWTSTNIRELSEDGRALAIYLLTCPHGTIAGVFRLPDGYACEDLQWSSERVKTTLAELFANGFATRCDSTKWVWITKHFEWNPPENPNQKKAAAKMAAQVPDSCAWKADFIGKCGVYMGLEAPQEPNPSATLPKPFPNQEQEQEQEQDKEVPIGTLSPAKLPPCPHDNLIDLFGQHLPTLPQPKKELWEGKNAEAMRTRWKWVMTAKKKNGDRYATTKDEALAWFSRFFGYVATSDFLSGRNGKWTACDLGWLVKADNFAKVLQGNYDNKAIA